MSILIDALIVLVMILINGFLAMAEIAMVSSRKPRLALRAKAGDQDYQEALDIANEPGNFLSTVQIGITLVGILAGAFGGATLAGPLGKVLIGWGMAPGISEAFSVSIIVVITTYFSLVLGELIPKQIGLINPEKIAAALARPMNIASKVTYPLVYILSVSTSLVMRVLGIRQNEDPEVTEEEVKLIIDQGTQLGIFESIEDTIVDRVFMLGDTRIQSLITPRTDIVWLDIKDPVDKIIEKINEQTFSHFPIARGHLDNLVGFVKANDLLVQSLRQGEFDLNQVLLKPLYLPKHMPVYNVLEQMRDTGYEIAFVIDEFGGILGLVSLRDLLEALVGDIPQVKEMHDPDVVRRDDGTLLIDGMIPTQEFRELFNIKEELPDNDENYYKTLGGFVMYLFRDIPKAGMRVKWKDYTLEVVDMDGLRIDKILVTKHKK